MEKINHNFAEELVKYNTWDTSHSLNAIPIQKDQSMFKLSQKYTIDLLSCLYSGLSISIMNSLLNSFNQDGCMPVK
jgi:hypothetical protein